MKVYNLFATKVVKFDSNSDFESQKSTVAKELLRDSLKENFVEKFHSNLLTYVGDGTTVEYVLPGGLIGFKIELGTITNSTSEYKCIQDVGFYLYDVATGNVLKSGIYKHIIKYDKAEKNNYEKWEYVFYYSQDKIYTVENEDSFLIWFPTGNTTGLEDYRGATTEGGGFMAIDRTFNDEGYTVAFSCTKYTSVGLYRLSDKKSYQCLDASTRIKVDVGITFREQTRVLNSGLKIVEVFRNIYNIFTKSTFTKKEYNICGPGHELYIDGKVYRQITGNIYIEDKEASNAL